MTLELTIQEMFNKFPGLFKERSDCLDHLFCTIGNGYDWKDGELVYGCYGCGYDDNSFDEASLESCLVNGKAFQHNKLSLRAEAIYYAKKHKMERDQEEFDPEFQAMFDEADKKYFNSLPDDVYHKRPREQRWYFYLGGYCTRHAYLFNYPEDIKPDWLAGIEECKAMLREDGYDVDNPDKNPIDTTTNLEEYRRTLKEYL